MSFTSSFTAVATSASSGNTTANLTIHVAKMSQLHSTAAHARAARASQHFTALISGIRGRFHHYSQCDKPCVITETDGTVHLGTYAKIPVEAVFSRIRQYLTATVQLQECEASWLALHRSGVLSCQSSYSMPATDTTATKVASPGAGASGSSSGSRVLTVTLATSLLGMHDAHSLHRYVSRVLAAPMRACHEAVRLLAGLGDPSDMLDPPSTSSTSSTSLSMSLQPVRLWQAWVHSLCELLQVGGGGYMQVLWKEMGELHLIAVPEEGTCSGGDVSSLDSCQDIRDTDCLDFISEWLGEESVEQEQDEEGKTSSLLREAERFANGGREGGWSLAAESVLREVNI